MNLKWEIRIFINHIRSIQRQDFPRVSTFVFLSFLRNRCWKGNVATIPHTQSILNPLTISRAIRANDLIKRMGFCRISTSPSSMPPLSPAQGVEFRSSRRPPIVHRNRSNVLTPRVITLLAPGNSRRTHRFLSNPPPPNLTLRPVSNEHVSVHVGKRDGNVRSNIVSPPFVFHANSTGMKRIRSNRWRTDGSKGEGLGEIYFITTHHTFRLCRRARQVARELSFRDYSKKMYPRERFTSPEFARLGNGYEVSLVT